MFAQQWRGMLLGGGGAMGYGNLGICLLSGLCLVTRTAAGGECREGKKCNKKSRKDKNAFMNTKFREPCGPKLEIYFVL